MSRRAKPPRPTYRSLEEDPTYEHVVDRMVRLRVRGRALKRTAAYASHAIVKALGAKRRLWFRYERAADTLRVRREAAFFDAGVELGSARCTVRRLAGASKTVKGLADRIVRELLATGVARDDAVRAAVAAAWALVATGPCWQRRER